MQDAKTLIKKVLTRIHGHERAGRIIQYIAAERVSWFRLDRSTLFVIVMAVLGAAHVLVRTSTYGAALTGDAVSYLSAAENLMAGKGLQDFRGTGLLQWPPLFPLLLAAVGLAGIEPLDAARLVNVTACGLIILVSGLWLRRSLRSPLPAMGAVLALSTSYPLGYFSSFIITDPIFVLFTLLALMQMETFSSRTVRWRPLVLAALFTALAALTRYAGIAVIVTGILMLLLCRKGGRGPLAAGLNRTAVYGAISSVPVGAVFVRNYVLFGDYDRKTTRIGQPLLTSLDQIAGLFHEAVMPANVPGWIGVSLLWSFVLAVPAGVVIYVYTAIKRRAKPPFNPTVLPSPPIPARTFNVAGWESARPFAMFSLVYPTFIFLVLSWVGGSGGIFARHLLPLYVSLFLLGPWLFDRFLRIRTHGWQSAAKRVSAALVLIVCLGHFGFWAQKSFDLTAQALESGFIGDTFNTVQWDQSETITYLRANPVDARVYCNSFGLLHGLLALETGTNVRGKYPTLPSKRHTLARRIEDGVYEDGTYIVWLKSVKLASHYDFDDADLRVLPEVEMVVKLSDGVIFRVDRDAVEAERNIKSAR